MACLVKAMGKGCDDTKSNADIVKASETKAKAVEDCGMTRYSFPKRFQQSQVWPSGSECPDMYLTLPLDQQAEFFTQHVQCRFNC